MPSQGYVVPALQAEEPSLRGENRDEPTEVPARLGRSAREVLAHYDGQTEDEQFADIEAARAAEGMTLMAVPTALVDEVRALIARKQSA